ncbi:hypothetical protein [Syntrophus aciditrophicus]|uniref:Hypothetical membrane protein n=1 Tax=Syntrophus aciditrophicus (strain SB) TaxID=56780 RepID=Q2LWQ8_SYNAS|nr:hypothetical protein [Syntrophus aciditrophicus]ABC78515.1 hypothetical membrane protein [Syntrophus aciditrophicus SB]
MPNEKRYLHLAAAVISGLVVLFIYLHLVDDHTRTNLVRENGPIELMSALGYFVVPLIMFIRGGWSFIRRHASLAVLVVALGLRELDFNARFTTMSITKIKFFLSPQVPLGEKIIAVLLILILLAALVDCLKKYLRPFLAGCAKKDVVSMTAGVSLLFMAISKSLDGLPRKLRSLGLDIAGQNSLYAESAEEILELGIPLMLIISTLAYFSRHASKTGSPSFPGTNKPSAQDDSG